MGLIFNSQDAPAQPAPAQLAPDDDEVRRKAMARVAMAMADLTQRGAKAHRSGMDSVRVPVDHLFVVCQAMYAVLGPQVAPEA